VFEVRRLRREVEAAEDDHRVRHVGEAVDGLGADREAAGRPPDGALRRDERDVGGEHDEPDAPDRPLAFHHRGLPLPPTSGF